MTSSTQIFSPRAHSGFVWSAAALLPLSQRLALSSKQVSNFSTYFHSHNNPVTPRQPLHPSRLPPLAFEPVIVIRTVTTVYYYLLDNNPNPCYHPTCFARAPA